MGNFSEKDFILWYTAKHYDPKASNEDIIKVISDVADILVHVQSDVLQSSILAELKDKYKKGSLWKTALADAARRLKEEKNVLPLRNLMNWSPTGSFGRVITTMIWTSRAENVSGTNFIIKPLFLIIDDTRPTRIFELENENRVRKTVELQQADVTKLERFKEQIEGKGNYRFFEKPDKYELMKAYIYEKTEEAQRIVQMGWNLWVRRDFMPSAMVLSMMGVGNPLMSLALSDWRMRISTCQPCQDSQT